jgi:hypothetical protein
MHFTASMTFPIKYKISSQPKKVKRISDVLIGVGAILLIVGNFLYTPLASLPLELQVFAIGEIIPRIFLDFNFLSVAILTSGIILIPFKWRRGKVELETDGIKIDGVLPVSILLEKMIEIDVFDADHGVKRTIHINSKSEKVRLKFRNSSDFEGFAAKLIDIAGRFENIQLKSWAAFRTE